MGLTFNLYGQDVDVDGERRLETVSIVKAAAAAAAAAACEGGGAAL